MVDIRQFDVCRLQDKRSGSPGRLVLILQHDVLDQFDTRIVAPLVPVDDSFTMRHAVVMVEIAGAQYAVAMQLMSSVPVRELGPRILNLDGQQAVFKRAIDLLFLGF